MASKDDLFPQLIAELAVPKQLVDVSWVANLTREWAEIGKALQASITIPDFSKLNLEESVRDGFRTMASRGWTVQMSLTPRDLAELADKKPEEADEFFVALYTEDDFAELRKVRKEYKRFLNPHPTNIAFNLEPHRSPWKPRATRARCP